MDEYIELRTLGRGAFAVVKLVQRKSSQKYFVIKKFHTLMDDLSAKERTEIAREIKLLAHMKHPNVVQFVDSFIQDGIMHIVMEYASGGTLYKRIVNQDGELLPEHRIWEVFVQILLAVKYVHSCNVMHRDLKSQNVMLSGTQNRIIKLGDFGIAKVLSSQNDMASSIVGTPHYLAPELCQGQQYNRKSDVWALGCILYELACLHKPFDASNMPAIIFSIMRNQPKPLPEHYSPDLKHLVSLVLQPSPADRPSVDEIAAMPIVQAEIKRWLSTRRKLEGMISPSPTAHQVSFDISVAPGRKVQDETESNDRRKMNGSPVKSVDPAMLEQKLMEEIDDIKSAAASGMAPGSRTQLSQRLKAIEQAMNSGPELSGRIWESVGGAWADSGNFDRAIKGYRRALRSKNANASLGAMEQLGNLLVRRAQQVWALAKLGDIRGAENAVSALGNTAATAVGALMRRFNKEQRRKQKRRHRTGSRRRSREDRHRNSSRGNTTRNETTNSNTHEQELYTHLEKTKHESTTDKEDENPQTTSNEPTIQGLNEEAKKRPSEETKERSNEEPIERPNEETKERQNKQTQEVTMTQTPASPSEDDGYSAGISADEGNENRGQTGQDTKLPSTKFRVTQQSFSKGDYQSTLLPNHSPRRKRSPKRSPRANRFEDTWRTMATDDGGTTMGGAADGEYDEDEPLWRTGAASIIGEGLGLLERLVNLGATAERYSLLGSAYKRRAWTGLGSSRKSDLRKAAAAYAKAHQLELNEVASNRAKDAPSPYARLNQLTFELLACSGKPHELETLLMAVKQAEEWALARDPADVWQWVQVADARCLRWLLADSDISLENVVKGYREQFAFGASHRVKASVLDQLGFMAEVLEGRLIEELHRLTVPHSTRSHDDSNHYFAIPISRQSDPSTPGSFNQTTDSQIPSSHKSKSIKTKGKPEYSYMKTSPSSAFGTEKSAHPFHMGHSNESEHENKEALHSNDEIGNSNIGILMSPGAQSVSSVTTTDLTASARMTLRTWLQTMLDRIRHLTSHLSGTHTNKSSDKDSRTQRKQRHNSVHDDSNLKQTLASNGIAVDDKTSSNHLYRRSSSSSSASKSHTGRPRSAPESSPIPTDIQAQNNLNGNSNNSHGESTFALGPDASVDVSSRISKPLLRAAAHRQGSLLSTIASVGTEHSDTMTARFVLSSHQNLPKKTTSTHRSTDTLPDTISSSGRHASQTTLTTTHETNQRTNSRNRMESSSSRLRLPPSHSERSIGDPSQGEKHSLESISSKQQIPVADNESNQTSSKRKLLRENSRRTADAGSQRANNPFARRASKPFKTLAASNGSSRQISSTSPTNQSHIPERMRSQSRVSNNSSSSPVAKSTFDHNKQSTRLTRTPLKPSSSQRFTTGLPKNVNPFSRKAQKLRTKSEVEQSSTSTLVKSDTHQTNSSVPIKTTGKSSEETASISVPIRTTGKSSEQTASISVPIKTAGITGTTTVLNSMTVSSVETMVTTVSSHDHSTKASLLDTSLIDQSVSSGGQLSAFNSPMAYMNNGKSPRHSRSVSQTSVSQVSIHHTPLRSNRPDSVSSINGTTSSFVENPAQSVDRKQEISNQWREEQDYRKELNYTSNAVGLLRSTTSSTSSRNPNSSAPLWKDSNKTVNNKAPSNQVITQYVQPKKEIRNELNDSQQRDHSAITETEVHDPVVVREARAHCMCVIQ